MNKTVDWSALRKDFSILNQEVHGKPLVYFDNAATSQKPRSVIAALAHYYERDNANVHRGIHELSNRATNAFEAACRRRPEVDEVQSRSFLGRGSKISMDGKDLFGKHEGDAGLYLFFHMMPA